MKIISLLSLFLFTFSIAMAQRLNPDKATAEQVIDRFIRVQGGKWKISKIRHTTSKLKININEKVKCTGMVYQGTGRKFALYFLVYDNVFHRQIFDGKRALIINNADTTEIVGEDLEKFKILSWQFPEVEYRKQKFELNKLDMEYIAGREVFQIEAVSPSGVSIVNFYDVKSGLKVRTIQMVKMRKDSVMQIVDYGKYRVVSGVKFPLSKVITTEDQTMGIQVVAINIRDRIKRDIYRVKTIDKSKPAKVKRNWLVFWKKGDKYQTEKAIRKKLKKNKEEL